jgi:hypothetical protein
VLFVVLAVALGFAQSQPDFSGHWVLVRPENPGPGVAGTLIVQQPIARQNVHGAPMEPAYLRITIERRFVSSTRTETYAIGARGGSVSGTATGGERTTTVFVRWEDQRLVIDTTNSSRGTTAACTEVWQYDAASMLLVTTTERVSGREPVTTSAA